MSDSEALNEVRERVGIWPSILQTSMTSIHPLEGTDGDTTYAVVVHNPFDLSQYQVLAILPGIGANIAITETVRESMYEILRDVTTDEDLQEVLAHLRANRLRDSMENDHEFAHKMVDAKFSGMDMDDIAEMYQEHYGLTGGGDFNRPLY